MRHSSPQPKIPDQLLSQEKLKLDLLRLGIVSAAKLTKPSKNDVYIGIDQHGIKHVVKLYSDFSKRRQEGKRAITEIRCYQELADQLPLPPLVVANDEEGYLVTQFLELRDLTYSQRDIDAAIDLILNKLNTVQAPAFPEIGAEYYQQDLPGKIAELVSHQLITPQEANQILAIITAQQETIARTPKTFSHQTLKLDDIKYDHEGKIVLLDPEFACRDIPEYDAMSLVADLSDNPEAMRYAMEKFAASPKLNPALFKAMLVRRCVNLVRVFANMGKANNPFCQKYLTLLKRILAGS